MGLRELKKNHMRQDILAAARRLFLKKGFDATRVRDIAQRLQISEPTVFKYFPSKHAIVEALAEEWVATSAASAAAHASVPRKETSLLANGRRNLARYLESLSSERDLLRLLLDHSSFGSLQPSRKPASARDSGLLRGARGQAELFGQGYRAAQHAGELRGDIDPRELAEIVLAVIGTCLRTWVDTEPAPDLVELVFRRVGLVMDGARIGPRLDVMRALADVRAGR